MKVINGDLLNCFLDGNQAAFHQTNCLRSCGRGICPQIRAKWPQAYQADLDFQGEPKDRLGQISIGETPDGIIFNLYGQLEYANRSIRNTNYEAFYQGLVKIRTEMLLRKLTKLATCYKVGSDLGGASWSIISAMIDDVFSEESGIEVTAYNINRKA